MEKVRGGVTWNLAVEKKNAYLRNILKFRFSYV